MPMLSAAVERIPPRPVPVIPPVEPAAANSLDATSASSLGAKSAVSALPEYTAPIKTPYGGRAGFSVTAAAGNNWVSWSRNITVDLVEMAQKMHRGWVLGAAADLSFFWEGIPLGERFSLGFALNAGGNLAAVADQGLLSLLGNGFPNGAHGSLSFRGALYGELAILLRGSVPLPNRSLTLAFKPAIFVPLLYAAPDSSISISIDSSGDPPVLEADINYNAVFYMPFTPDDPWGILSSLGMDISLEAEYPMRDNLDLGLFLRHIPLIPATPKYRLTMKETAPEQIDNLLAEDTLTKLGNLVATELITTENYTERNRRPFALGISARYRPLTWLRVDALAGMVFDGYSESIPFSPEYRLGVDLRSPYVVGFSLSHSYQDHLFAERAGLIFDFNVLEIGLSAAFSSQDFLKSFSLAGLEFSLGLTAKF
jgi:hypothetical protein